MLFRNIRNVVLSEVILREWTIQSECPSEEGIIECKQGRLLCIRAFVLTLLMLKRLRKLGMLRYGWAMLASTLSYVVPHDTGNEQRCAPETPADNEVKSLPRTSGTVLFIPLRPCLRHCEAA